MESRIGKCFFDDYISLHVWTFACVLCLGCEFSRLG